MWPLGWQVQRTRTGAYVYAHINAVVAGYRMPEGLSLPDRGCGHLAEGDSILQLFPKSPILKRLR